jgi:hypothetical protein
MTYHGRVKNGVIVLDEPVPLPEGTEVKIEPVEPVTEKPSVWDKLLELEGTAHGLPADVAERHDHYRRQRLQP